MKMEDAHAAAVMPELAHAPMEALRAAVAKRDSFSLSDLDALRSALSSSSVPVYESASYIAADAASYDTRAVDLIVDLSRNSRAHVRRNAIICIDVRTPRDVALDMVGRGLVDKSGLVRTKAADWLYRLELRAALPMLERALASERVAAVLRTMEFGYYLLRDGYLLGNEINGKVYVTVHRDGGGTLGTFIDLARVAEQGIERVAADLRRKP